MWGLGLDVLPKYRPNYSTTACNIASQKVAYKAGYMPAWMSDNKLRFEGELSNS